MTYRQTYKGFMVIKQINPDFFLIFPKIGKPEVNKIIIKFFKKLNTDFFCI